MVAVLNTETALPLILASDVIALDTEFDGSVPPSQTDLHWVSLAGGEPGSIVCAAWCFQVGNAWSHDWSWFFDRVIVPIFNDPERIVVMHPLKVDMQLLRARGLTDELTRCDLRDTIAMTHVVDDNLPRGLKDQAQCLLGHVGALSYKATQRELEEIVKDGRRDVKARAEMGWQHYKLYRRKSSDEPRALPDADCPPHIEEAMRLPPKMLKADVVAHITETIEPAIAATYQDRVRRREEAYASKDAGYTLELFYRHHDHMTDEDDEHADLETLVSHPVVTVMEERGLLIDVLLLSHIYGALGDAIEDLHAYVSERWGETMEGEFNPNSSDQVAHILWNVWRERPPPWAVAGGAIREKFRRAKDGLCATDKDVLSHMARSDCEHASDVQDILDLRRLVKLKSSPVEPMLEKALGSRDRRIHAALWPTGARSGRFSSSNPNIENIPRGDTMPSMPVPDGDSPSDPPPGYTLDGEVWRIRSLRDVFIAPDGWTFVSADLSQVENRLIAHESQDRVMLDLYCQWDCAGCGGSGQTTQPLHNCPKCGADEGKRDKAHPDQPAIRGFCLGRDIHAKTSVYLGLPERWGSAADGRQRAKAVNHAASYGMGAATLARRERFTRKEADAYLAGWHDCYRGVRPLHKRVERDIRTNGAVTLFNGKQRRFRAAKLLHTSGCIKSWEWESTIRQGVNVLAQGGTAVLMKRAMVTLYQKFQSPHLRGKVYMVNQIHDELLIEAREEVAAEVFVMVRHAMENSCELSVPIIADGAMGKSWGAAH